MMNFLTFSPISDSVALWDKQAKILADAASTKDRFWLIEDLWDLLVRIGIGEKIADLLAFAAACAVLALLVCVVDKIVIRISLALIKRAAAKSKTDLDDIFVQRKFFSRLFQLLPLIVVLGVSDHLFAGFKPGMIILVDVITKSIIVYVVLLIIYSILNALNDIYLRKPQAQQKSIKGYTQVAKIILGFIAGILIVSILLQEDPTSLFVGLGATAAIFTLVFKDTILGFVASIQLSAQDMVRPGDWIEMPAKNADGTVLDINVNSVKVQNWDNTITMIPIYSMVSESFTNWRGMEQSQGRRFVRSIYVNIESVRFVDDQLLERLKGSSVIGAHYDDLIALARLSSPDTMTNLALFRSNIELFLRHDPKINDQLTLYVRYKPDISDKGMGIEIYAFTFEKAAQDYDIVHRSVMEYVVASAPLFGIVLFQSPSGEDFRSRMK